MGFLVLGEVVVVFFNQKAVQVHTLLQLQCNISPTVKYSVVYSAERLTTIASWPDINLQQNLESH